MTQDALHTAPVAKNRNVGLILLVLAVAMVGAAYAAVPLYYAFCAATGYGGTTERAIAVLTDADLPGLFTRATDAALARSRELAAG